MKKVAFAFFGLLLASALIALRATGQIYYPPFAPIGGGMTTINFTNNTCIGTSFGNNQFNLGTTSSGACTDSGGTLNAYQVVMTNSYANVYIPHTTYSGSGGSAVPTCNSGANGWRVYVSDGAASPAYRGAYTAGAGTTSVYVYCNGTSWLYD